MGFFTKQLRSVIQWQNPASDALFSRWSENGDEIKDASQLIVGPGQGCVFVYEGSVDAIHAVEGIHSLDTDNIPFITTLKRFMQGFVSEHKVGIYFFKTTTLIDLKWGTPSIIKYQDPVYQFPVGLRAFGNYSMRIRDPGTFFREIVGVRDTFFVDDLRQPLNARIVQPLVDLLAESAMSYAEIDAKRDEIASALSTKLAPELTRLGFELMDFRIEGTTFDEDTMQRINLIANTGAEVQAARAAGVSYADLQRLGALRDAARNQGMAGMGVGMAMGVGMGGPFAAGLGAGASSGGGAAAVDDSAAKLRRLKELFDQGLITQNEYDAKKAEILSRL